MSGRPVILNQGEKSPAALSDAIIWGGLPGTQGGEAIMNALTGAYELGKRRDGHEYKEPGPNTLTTPWIGLKDPLQPVNSQTILAASQVEVVYPVGHRVKPEVISPQPARKID